MYVQVTNWDTTEGDELHVNFHSGIERVYPSTNTIHWKDNKTIIGPNNERKDFFDHTVDYHGDYVKIYEVSDEYLTLIELIGEQESQESESIQAQINFLQSKLSKLKELKVKSIESVLKNHCKLLTFEDIKNERKS